MSIPYHFSLLIPSALPWDAFPLQQYLSIASFILWLHLRSSYNAYKRKKEKNLSNKNYQKFTLKSIKTNRNKKRGRGETSKSPNKYCLKCYLNARHLGISLPKHLVYLTILVMDSRIPKVCSFSLYLSEVTCQYHFLFIYF